LRKKSFVDDMEKFILNSARGLMLIFISAQFGSTPVFAQQIHISPGAYLTRGGWGLLIIRAGKDGKLPFEISAVGTNAHTCSLEGQMQNGKATLEALEENNPCVVTFTPGDQEIEVSDNDGVCRNYYCGVRAGFTGTYVRPKPACEIMSMKTSRGEFKKLYDTKEYLRAKSVLEPLLQECEYLFNFAETSRVRNDLAITYYKLGEYSACLNILQPLEDDAKLSDAELMESYPPADAEMRTVFVKATRTNSRLCKRGMLKVK
jgi:hypothetical protein